jgi:cyanophycinase-like exopeptidase
MPENMFRLLLSMLVLGGGWSVGISQGSLLLLGGGNEADGNWSDSAYAWAIQQAPNQRVALISHLEESDWLPEHLLSLGAKGARNFWITSPEMAQEAWLQDSLLKYDCLVIRGDDPWICSQLYRGSQVDSALQETFQKGGVIGGHNRALSLFGDRFFSARMGSIPAGSALTNLYAPQLTLEAGLLRPYEGFVFESDFYANGGLSRILALMARSGMIEKKRLDGIGIESRTALGVNARGMSKVWGEGAVYVLLDDLVRNSFSPNGQSVSLDSLRLIRLLEGNQFDLISWEIRGIAAEASGPTWSASVPYPGTILLSSSLTLSENLPLLTDLVNGYGESYDPILLISEQPSPSVDAAMALLASLGVISLPIYTSEQALELGPEAENIIQGIQKFLFLDNEADSLASFFAESQLGKQIRQAMSLSGSVLAFLGDDCQLAGRSVVRNLSQAGAAKQGRLSTQEGLDILPVVIFPLRYEQPDHLENIGDALPWLMKKDSLRYGLLLQSETYLRYQIQNQAAVLQSVGPLPHILIDNWQGTFSPRLTAEDRVSQLWSYRDFRLSLLSQQPRSIGSVAQNTASAPLSPVGANTGMSVFPNPIKDEMNVLLNGAEAGSYTFQLVDGNGKSVLSQTLYIQAQDQLITIAAPGLAIGVYVLQIRKEEQGVIQSIQVIR